ncbi:TNF receptor-associated factor 1-like [Hydractinia symbiolongicarpus]|uniref:TNF receptor-associated factor 1-like n=1 Tax=Hydractinia symbiolongicarpus TaxID=13093 RepID=UPI00254ED518|nr:TNF receptor-associated factor 1-like [Hydractinia symbiolongicarpus]
MSARLAREKASDNLINNLLPRVEFKDVPPISVYCCKCGNVLQRPLQLSCGHRCCTRCEKDIPVNEAGQKHCPVDDELIEMKFPDISALTEIMFLLCYCVSKDEGCAWEGKLLDLEDHLKLCDFSPNLPCPWSGVHCDFTGSKKQLEEHLKGSSTKHNSLFATFLSQIVESFDAGKHSMNELRNLSSKLRNRLDNASDNVKATQVALNETLNFLNQQGLKQADLRTWYADVDRRLTSLERDGLPEMRQLEGRIKDLFEKVEKQQSMLKDATTGSKAPQLSSLLQTKKQVEEKTANLEKTGKQHHSTLQDIDLKIRLFQSATFNGNYIWKLDNLKNRFAGALSGTIGELYTPPLYTSPFGYKFSVKVLLYGDPKDRESGISSTPFISLYFVLMKGDYDEILSYPFKYPITITLENLSKKDNISHKIIPDEKIHFQQPFSEMNPAIGFSKFCSHEKLHSDGFIKDDAIYFKIVVDKPDDVP